MTDVHPSVLAALDAASSASYPSHSIVAEGLAVAADRQAWPEAELRHLEALRAAMLFFTRSDGTFRGEYHGSGEAPWPREVRQIPQDAQEMWAAYAQAAHHPAVRARLHHLLWAARHGERPIEHLRAAVDAYRQTAPILRDGTGTLASIGRMQAADALVAAYGLAASTGQPVLADVVADMLDLADMALGWEDPAPGVVATLTEPLLEHREYHDRLRPLLERAVDVYRSDLHNGVLFLTDLRKTAADDDERSAIDQRVIDAYTDHAERFGGVAKLMCLEEAAAYAQKMGLAEALEEIRRQQQRLTREDLDLARIGLPIQIPAGFFTPALTAIDAADDLGEAFRAVAAATPLLPKAADTPILEDTLQGLLRLPTAKINMNGPVVTTPLAKAGSRPVGTDTRTLVLDLHGLQLEAQLDRIQERFAPTVDDLLALFVRPPVAPPERMRGLARAFQAYFEHDDDVAVELALIRIEGLLRRHLKATDISVIQHAQGDRPGQVSQLGALIADMKTAGFEAPWPTVFRLLLADPNEGMNLRNEVLHDLTERRPPRHRIALVLQAALVVLRSITAHEPPEEAAGADTPG
ncbi:DUF7380 domain-containing protein [Streptomyces capitiformicae]|uniref:DUF7380 domain-containing protein n=1 Tax=Streptomyces capitiformicae TaxID=2014920 RepID=A0A919DKI1_9ACTN|nr:hypothetical protein [Streptomyces capitiformicae]GHE51435.1 hypothetical protein GCM10017771_73670 [Streptomyces capitiformicae]